jgi:hypothetical protein
MDSRAAARQGYRPNLFGVDLENSQTMLSRAAPAGTSSTVMVLNSNTTSTLEKYPDILVKVAADPSFGRFDLVVIARFLRSYETAVGGQTRHTNPVEASTSRYSSWFFRPRIYGLMRSRAMVSAATMRQASPTRS